MQLCVRCVSCHQAVIPGLYSLHSECRECKRRVGAPSLSFEHNAIMILLNAGRGSPPFQPLKGVLLLRLLTYLTVCFWADSRSRAATI